MKFMKILWNVLKSFKNAILLSLIVIFQYTFTQSYTMTLFSSTAFVIVGLLAAWDVVKVMKRLLAMKDEAGKVPYYTMWVVLSIAALLIVVPLSISAASLATPINLYETTKETEPEKDVIYVTYHPDCEYCKASYSNMIRAVRSYHNSHLRQIRTVDLSKSTPLADYLNERLDHYGSILKVDGEGTLHESMYTTGDKDGNPVANTPTNIYNRIDKVATE